MKASFPVNHNYYEESPILETDLVEIFGVSKAKHKTVKNLFSSVYELKIGSEQLHNIKLLDFNKNSIFDIDNDRLVLKMYKKEQEENNQYFVQTGLYAGVLFYKGCEINITSKYGDVFLKRMLNFINDIYIDNVQHDAKKETSNNQFIDVVAYLFMQTLEKASVLGLPQAYLQKEERSHKVKGSIDFNAYLRKDIPFQGKLTSKFQEQQYIQEIVDVLYSALQILDSLLGKNIHNKLFNVSQLLKQNHSGKYVGYDVIQKAKNHKVLNNPLYGNFKKVLEYADIIINSKSLTSGNDNKQTQVTGYLFDIAEVFELYIEKVLSRGLVDWSINAQEKLDIYPNNFYKRSMFPDIVMRHKNTHKVVVLDAKFKSMNMLGSDVDRSDLYQIHTYMGYYHNDLVAGGLIYPFSKPININQSHSDTFFGRGNNTIKFMIDGIHIDESFTMQDIETKEEEFVERLSQALDSV